jgi:uncharacterized protein YjbI with pentapeptide repeats
LSDDDAIGFRINARVVPTGPEPPRVYLKDGLQDVRFSVADDVDVMMSEARMERVDFSGIRFERFRAEACVFVDCNFSRITSRTGGTLGYYPGSTYVGCNFHKADLRRISPGWARFERCAFTDVRMRDWMADNASFVDCVFSGRIVRSAFYGRRTFLYPDETTSPPPNEVIGNDFANAELVDVSFRSGVDLSRQRLPDGPNYILVDRWPQRVERARQEIESWSNGSLKRTALHVLDIYWNDDHLQLWKWIRRDNLAKTTPAEVLHRLHAELERPLADKVEGTGSARRSPDLH